MEAVYCGCTPVAPRRLAYKEFYEDHVDTLYDDDTELFKILTNLCNKKALGLLNEDYKHLVLPFNSKKWITRINEIMNLDAYVAEM